MTNNLTESLIEAVRDMRTAQRNYFSDRSPFWLNRAKDAEKRVDRLLSQLDDGPRERTLPMD